MMLQLMYDISFPVIAGFRTELKKKNNKQILSFQTTFVVARLPGKLMHQNSHKDFKYNSLKFSNEEKLAARS